MPTNHEYDYRKDEFLTDEEKWAIEQEHRDIARALSEPAPEAGPDKTMADTLRECAEMLIELTEVKAERDALRAALSTIQTMAQSMADLIDGDPYMTEITKYAEAALRGEEAADDDR